MEPTDLAPPGPRPDASTRAIDAHRGVRERVAALLADIDPAVAASTLVPACPDWTVTDTLAHVVGVCVDIHDGTMGDDVATAAWADRHVERFSALGVPALLERWTEVGPTIDSLAGVLPPLTASQFCFDAVTHEHDLRGALDQPGARDSDGVDVALGFIEAALDGFARRSDQPSIELVLPGRTVLVGPAERPRLRLEAEPFEVLRAFGGRRSAAQIRAMAWTGDPSGYLAMFESGPLAPPATDLVE